MGKIETEIRKLKAQTNRPLVWKRYIDDMISLWHTNKEVIHPFIEQKKRYHPTLKFTAEISSTETSF